MKRFFTKPLSVLLSLSMVFTILSPSAFSADGDTGTDVKPGESASSGTSNLTLDKTTLPLTVGETGTLTATYTGTETTPITWSSDKPEIVKIASETTEDDKGDTPSAQDDASQTSTQNVTAVAAGEATITATVGSETATCTVTVTKNIAITKIDLTSSLTTNTIEKGADNLSVTAAVDPSNNTEEINWVSSDASIATVTPDPDNQYLAKVKGLAPGKTDITATNESGSIVSNKITVTVSGITLTLKNPSRPITAGGYAGIVMNRFGSAVTNSLSSEDWKWESDNPSVAQAVASGPNAGQVIARAAGNATITCENEKGTYKNSIDITVLSATASAVSVSLKNNRIDFDDILSSLEDKCSGETSSSLNYITSLSVPTDQGTLYYSYVSSDNTGAGVASSKSYYVSPSTGQLDLKKITFIPKPDYSGDILISYNGYASSGVSYSGLISSTVRATSSSRISYSSDNGTVIRFQAADFSKYCQAQNGRDVYSVSFSTPSSRYGMLFYNYTSSSSGDESNVYSDELFYRTKSRSIDKLCFVPDEDYSGSFSISFKGTDVSGYSFSGSVYITINNNSSSSSSSSYYGDLYYTCRPGERVYFETYDFEDYCDDRTGRDLDYVRFYQPSSSKGRLYYDDDISVGSSTHFYCTGSSSTRLISDVSFLADEDYEGTVYINFEGTDESDRDFSGTVRIRVSDSSYSSSSSRDDDEVIRYSCASGKRVYFDSDDFSDASYDATNRQIDYVRFTPPSSSKGYLYYDRNVRVSSGTSYYRTGSTRNIDDISFLADEDYTGTVNIPFTGYNTNGKRFSGTVKIKVSRTGSSSGSNSGGSSNSTDLTISYTSDGTGVAFRTFDFTTACASGLSSALSYVQISSPDPSIGRLYVNYSSPTQNVSFNPNQMYSVNGTPSISQITFIPRAGYTGNLRLSFTGTGADGDTCRSSINIMVIPTGASSFTDMWKAPWAIPAVEFMKKYNVVEGTSQNVYSPTDPIRRSDYILMLHRIFNFTRSSGNSFQDVPWDGYYTSAVTAALGEGIIDSGSYFYPDLAVTREDAAKYLYRSLQSSGRTISPGNYADISIFPDAELVSSDAVEAMGALARAGVFVGDDFGRLNPSLTLNRAQLAVILHRALTR